MLSTATKKTIPFSTIDTGLEQCFTEYLNEFQNACKSQITPLYYKYPFILFPIISVGSQNYSDEEGTSCGHLVKPACSSRAN